MANSDVVGREGPAFDVVIELAKIREFALATGSHAPGYLEDEDAVVPPTFPAMSGFWRPAEVAPLFAGLDVDPDRLQHAEQEFIYTGVPPRAGDRLSVRTVVEEVYENNGAQGGRMTFVVLLTNLSDADGVVVAQSRSTAVQTGRVPLPYEPPQGD